MTICKNNADWHHYALDKSGALVHLKKGELITREDYFCIGCGKEVRPVMGDERDWHFRHKEINLECDHESWLHKFSKRFFKNKFESNETFEISYWVKEICPQYDNCSLRSNSCFRENLHKLDLKTVYDICVEEETNGMSLYRADLKFYNSKDPNIKPLFLEIAYTHDCKPEKIASRIQIVELKINKEEDLEKPIIEEKQLIFDYSNGNPYSFCPLPDIRFYNFERVINQSFSKDLRIFVIGKDKEGKIAHGLLGENTTMPCNILDIINIPSFLYMLFIPAEYIKANQNYNFWYYGLLRAALIGIDVRNCMLCRKCYPKHGGCVKYGNYMYYLLFSKEINNDEEALKCGNYTRYTMSDVKRALSFFKFVPYKEIRFI